MGSSIGRIKPPENADILMFARAARALLVVPAFALASLQPLLAQAADELGRAEALRHHHPALHALIGRLEAAHAVLFEELAREGESVRASGGDVPTFSFEFEMLDRLTFLVQDEAGGAAVFGEGSGEASGYDVLGARAAEIIRWGQAFQREVISVLADPSHPDPRTARAEPDVVDQREALDEVLSRYRSRPASALPGTPKNMNVLYGHDYALGFRSGYADLDGLIWAGHWLRLAATSPLTDMPPGPERAAAVDTVSARYYAKLTYGEPPQFFPSEIPLAPAIAPGLIWLSPQTAMIWDNLSMMLEVFADVLASPETTDVERAIDATIDFFLDPELAITDQDEWEIMALRHGIFFQGGYALAVMTRSERNTGGHAAHFQDQGEIVSIPGMKSR